MIYASNEENAVLARACDEYRDSQMPLAFGYDRRIAAVHDPYLETREKEDAFAGRIVEAVERKVMSNLPALFGMYMAQVQIFPLSVPAGAYPARGGMVYGQCQAGALPDGADTGNAVMNGAALPSAPDTANAATVLQGEKAETENASEPPDNELIDFDAF